MTAGILFVEKVLQKIFFKHLVTEIQEKKTILRHVIFHFSDKACVMVSQVNRLVGKIVIPLTCTYICFILTWAELIAQVGCIVCCCCTFLNDFYETTRLICLEINFIYSFLGLGKGKFVQRVWGTWPGHHEHFC